MASFKAVLIIQALKTADLELSPTEANTAACTVKDMLTNQLGFNSLSKALC